MLGRTTQEVFLQCPALFGHRSCSHRPSGVWKYLSPWSKRATLSQVRIGWEFRILPSATTSRLTSSMSARSEEHTSELQSPDHLVCRLLLEKKKTTIEV